MKKNGQLSIKSIVAIGIGAALFFVLGRFVSIPSPVPDTTINIQYGILGIFGVIYGPVVGAVSGFIGHVLIDLSWGSPWWSWIFASAVYGTILGLSKKKIAIEEGRFGAKEIVTFNIFQIIGHIVSWIIIAPILDILIYSESVEILFVQGLTAAIANVISTAIVGTILLGAYAKTRVSEGGLNKED